MAQSEDSQGLVTFEDPPVSVKAESLALSRVPLVAIIKHLKAVLDGDKNFNEFKVWKYYRGVPLFIAEIGGELMVYAVEDLGGVPVPACKISVMFAGLRRFGCTAGAGRWTGSNDEVLWTGVVLPRCERHFQ
jgi:hypothetical protein